MRKLSEEFPSKNMRAGEDIVEGESQVFTITGAEIVKFDDGNKVLVHFRESDKGFVASKTKANVIAQVLGSDDTDDWIGRRITLFCTQVLYQGKMVDSIQVSSKAPKEKAAATAGAAKPKPAKPADPQPDDDEDDSDIPFACPADPGPFEGETDNLFPRRRPIR